MAQVRIQNIIEKLDYEMKRALDEAVSRVLPDAEINRNALYKSFIKSVGRKCNEWVSISDSDVRKECEHCGKDS